MDPVRLRVFVREDPFEPLRPVVDRFRRFPRPWGVAGGWAVDLHLGRRSRPHGDVEVAVLRRDQAVLRAHLRGWRLQKAVPGPGTLEPWEEGERLELPVHEVHAAGPESAPERLEILLNEAEGDTWRYRRNLQVTRPLRLVFGRTDDGTPYLRPEIVLLFKAPHRRPVDEADFRRLRPYLDAGARRWLREVLARAHPGHPWKDRL